jgi:D-alanyl-D-alanine carboxypeptidase/D-alanyl-D-alanine-endopeptidase (penicillin-binding protein 4)
VLTAKRRDAAVLGIALTLLLTAPAAAASMPDAYVRLLERYRIPERSVSVFVQPVQAARPQVAHRAATPRNPASAIKLLTTLAALETLGPAHTWPTEFYAGGPVVRGELDGDLYIKGYGDPMLSSDRVWEMLKSLRTTGLQRVSGDLVLDDTYFDVAREDPAAFDGQPDRPYNVVPSALLLNFQTTRFLVAPEAGGNSVGVTVEPPLPGLVIDNKIRLVEGACPERGPSLAAAVVEGARPLSVRLVGRLQRGCSARSLYRVVSDAPSHALALVRSLWEGFGGRLDGGVRRAPVPEGAGLILRTESDTLAEAIRRVNKFSNNVMARQLLYNLGAVVHGAPGTQDKGRRAVSEWLAGLGMVFPDLVLDNGAGLSRTTQISAEQMGAVLLHAARGDYAAEFIASMPVAGLDGTLRRRLDDDGIAGRAHLKTGLLYGVRSIAGYISRADGHPVVVVIFINHARAHSFAGSAVIDGILKDIAGSG